MSKSAIEQLRRQMTTQYSYLDVLALALAKSGVTAFKGDSERWSEIVREARSKYPQLLSGIWFSERGYSEQLEDFFRVMARAGALSFANPRYERIDMSPEAAERIVAGAPQALEEHEESILDIARRLANLEYV